MALSRRYFATHALVSLRVFSIAAALSGESVGRSRVKRTCSITSVVFWVYSATGSPPKPKSASACEVGGGAKRGSYRRASDGRGNGVRGRARRGGTGRDWGKGAPRAPPRMGDPREDGWWDTHRRGANGGGGGESGERLDGDLAAGGGGLDLGSDGGARGSVIRKRFVPRGSQRGAVKKSHRVIGRT